MKINGHDYGMAYTVGAYLDIAEMKLGTPKTQGEVDKLYVYSALFMNKAHEDRKRLEDSEYKPTYLTLDQVRSMDYSFISVIRHEVDEAWAAGGKISVKTQPKKDTAKKNEGADTALS